MRRACLGVVALLIVAGCIGAAASTDSAQSLESTAADARDDKTENADLIGLWGVEPPQHVEGEQVTVDIYLDDTAGDGNAAGWAYAYLGDEKAGIVVVGDVIGVIGEAWYTFEGNESQEIREHITPIGEWSVDSEEAAEILAEDDRWPEMSESWATAWQLRGTEKGPIWHVEASNITIDGHGETVEAAVSASNGTILGIERDAADGFETEPEFEDRDEAPSREEIGCVADTDSGQVTPATDVETELELEEDGRITGQVSYTGAGPLDIAVLEDGDEEVYTDSLTATGSGTTSFEVHVPEGDYVVEASTPAGAINVVLQTQAVWGDDGACQGQSTTSTTSPTAPPIGALPATAYQPSDPTMGLAMLQDGFWAR